MKQPISATGVNDVAVVVPIYKRSPDVLETISLRQCNNVLARYPKFLLCSENMDTEPYASLIDAHPIRVHNDCFASTETYNQLLLSPAFYRLFSRYAYILIHQTDAFVFKDTLAQWCSKGYSYIGAPWRAGFTHTTPDSPFVGVGNGGLSLRCVSDCLRVVNYWRQPSLWLQLRTLLRPNRLQRLRATKKLILQTTPILRPRSKSKQNEDMIFGMLASQVCPGFRLPTPYEAAHFAIETQPALTCDLISDELPFGAHAWWRYEPDFWFTHIRNFGYQPVYPLT